MFQDFTKDRRGNFAMLFALSLTAIGGVTGLAIDYSNMSRIRQDIQNAADSAALASAKEPGLSIGERKKIAADYFYANVQDANITSFKVDPQPTRTIVNVTATIDTLFMSLLSVDSVDVDIQAQAQTSKASLEVVFALDVSGSMRHPLSMGSTRISELKSAAKTLLGQLEANTGYKIKAGIVPFNVSVNVGKDNASIVTDTNNPLFAGTEWKGCVFERAYPDHVADSPSGKWNAYIWPPMPNSTGGAGGSLLNPSNGTLTGYSTLEESSQPATDYTVDLTGPNFNCVRHPLVPLTDDLAALGVKIDNLTAESNQGTLIAPGVTWAMRLLSPAQPFNEGAKYTDARKVIIVITDGEQTTEAEYYGAGVFNQFTNSVEPWRYDPADYGLSGQPINTGYGPYDNLTAYGFIRDSRPFGEPVAANWAEHSAGLTDLSNAACDAAKAVGGSSPIEIYAIGVSDATAPGTLVYDALQNCASKPENHFYVKDKSDLEKTFENLFEEISALRLAS